MKIPCVQYTILRGPTVGKILLAKDVNRMFVQSVTGQVEELKPDNLPLYSCVIDSDPNVLVEV